MKVSFSKNTSSTKPSPEVNSTSNKTKTGNNLPERSDKNKGSSLHNKKPPTSQRPRRAAQRILKAMTAEIMSTSEGAIPGELFSFSAMFPDFEEFHEDPLQVFKAISDPDIMCYHQAMKQKDKKEFVKAIDVK